MSDLRDELYSLLVPLAGERLLVPRACVAEVIGYQTAVGNDQCAAVVCWDS